MQRRFVLQRLEDVTGISGTGIVAEGVEFSTRECAIRWTTHTWSVVFYMDIESVEKIHGHGGSTKIVWIDGENDG